MRALAPAVSRDTHSGARRRSGERPLISAIGNRRFGSLLATSPMLARYVAEEHTGRHLSQQTPGIRLSGSVGRGGENAADEIEAVRTRLETLGFATGYSIDALGSAIEEYQRDVLGFKRPDGRVDPGGQTLSALNAYRTKQVEPTPPEPKPPGPGPDPQPPAPGKLAPGDHVWYFNGQISPDLDIPRKQWFKGSTGPNDYQGHGDEIFNFVIHAGEIRRGRPHMKKREGSHAWLNNNPGNITGVKNGMDLGQYRNKFNWHRFLIFPTRDAGYAAIAKFLREGGYPAKTTGRRRWPAGKYRDLGIVEAFHRYAPEEDGNDPESYGREVAAAAGVPPDTLIRDLTDAQMKFMQDKIEKIEGTKKGVTLSRNSPELPEAVRALL